jgi:tetraacyldisaccharide 4'-kinase
MTFTGYLLSLATDKRRGAIASAVKFPLFVVSLAYGLCMRIAAYIRGRTPYSPQLKVISVGNITLGGTGKTVLVEYIAGFLAKEGRRIAVLSRGYKRPAGVSGLYGELGDEPGMLQKKFPGMLVIAGPDRGNACRRAEAHGCEAVILDDGFQQWGIRKDLDIVCIDAGGFGNGCVIPRGLLREPLPALRRAGVFVITNTGLAAANRGAGLRELLKRLNPRALVVESDHEPREVRRAMSEELCDPAQLKKAVLVCGIGNPESFFGCCQRAGIVPGARLAFPDHHRFDSRDVRMIADTCRREGVVSVVTTEKDEMRLPAGQLKERGLEVYVLSVALRITGNEKEFAGRLRGVFAA